MFRDTPDNSPASPLENLAPVSGKLILQPPLETLCENIYLLIIAKFSKSNLYHIILLIRCKIHTVISVGQSVVVKQFS